MPSTHAICRLQLNAAVRKRVLAKLRRRKLAGIRSTSTAHLADVHRQLKPEIPTALKKQISA